MQDAWVWKINPLELCKEGNIETRETFTQNNSLETFRYSKVYAGGFIMCEAFEEARQSGRNNRYGLENNIEALDVPCRYKAAFLRMTDNRGFRFKDDTLSQMEEIGKTDSDVLIPLLGGKVAGLIVPYILSTYLDSDKERAQVIEYLSEKREKVTEKNVLKAILTFR